MTMTKASILSVTLMKVNLLSAVILNVIVFNVVAPLILASRQSSLRSDSVTDGERRSIELCSTKFVRIFFRNFETPTTISLAGGSCHHPRGQPDSGVNAASLFLCLGFSSYIPNGPYELDCFLTLRQKGHSSLLPPFVSYVKDKV